MDSATDDLLQPWDNQPLGPDGSLIALALVKGGEVCVAAQSTSGQPQQVPIARLSTFLRRHAKCLFAAENAADFHWRLIEALQAVNAPESEAQWWRISAERRLLDVGIWHWRLRWAQGARVDPSESTVNLAQNKGLVHRTGQDLALQSAAAVVRGIAAECLRINAEAVALQRSVLAELDDEREIATLGVGTDVQGEIALAWMHLSRGPEVKAAAAHDLHQQLDARIEESSLLLRKKGPPAADAFKWGGSRPELTETGLPKVDAGFNAWSRAVAKEILLERHVPFDPPITGPKKHPSNDPHHWGDLIHCHPHLHAWWVLHQACRTQAWLRTLPTEMQTPFVYDMLPRLELRAPDFNLTDRPWTEYFKVVDPNRLVEVCLHDLDLRCWEATCRREWPATLAGRLVGDYANGKDAIACCIEALEEAIAADRGQATSETPPDAPSQPAPRGARWSKTPLGDANCADETRRKFVEAMLWAISHGMTAPVLLSVLLKRTVFQNGSPSDGQANDLLHLFQEDVYPESWRVYHDDTGELTAERLHVSRAALDETVYKHLDDELFDPASMDTERIHDKKAIAIRQALEPKSSLWELRQALADLSPDKDIRDLLQDDQTDRAKKHLLTRSFVTRRGRIGPPAFSLYRRVEQAKALADEIRKEVAYRFVASGADLTAIWGNAFLLRSGRNTDAGDQWRATAQTVVDEHLKNVGCNCARFEIVGSQGPSRAESPA